MLRTKNGIEENLNLFAALQENDYKKYELNKLKADVYERVFEEVSKLPARMRTVIQAAYSKGLTNKEIAELLDVSEQTIKNQKTDALNRLRIAFEGKPLLFALFCLFGRF
jgi:RNA polymerase sigma factor (sigma-70 family)